MRSEDLAKATDYHRRARELANRNAATTLIKLAVVSSFTADVLRPFLIVECDQVGLAVTPWFGPFGQLEQCVLATDSDLWNEKPDVLWIAARIDDLDRSWMHETVVNPQSRRDRLLAQLDRILLLVGAARARSRCIILVSNFTQPDFESAGVFDASDPDGFAALIAEFNRELARRLSAIADAYVLDYAGVIRSCGSLQSSDPKLWYLARVVGAFQSHVLLARQVARTIGGCLRPPAKCIVLDLDNTLWGGVVGDDGISALQLGDGYPGNVFKHLQSYLLSLRQRGVLLAVCSKNDESTVLEALEHPEMLIRRDHLAAIRANWRPKAENLKEIARELNIGVESLVFVDDNPVERASVRAELPSVHVIELPPAPLGFLAAIQRSFALDQPGISAEDGLRAEMYRAESQRRQSQESSPSVKAFLAGLEMRAEVGACRLATVQRVHQLLHKTNQFNLTTRRHNLSDIVDWMNKPSYAVETLRLHDRYGDMGIVCVGILRSLEPSVWEIDTFLMSCRVMGRGVETAFLAHLADRARTCGARHLIGNYLPTAKNSCVADFFPRHHFRSVARNESGAEEFRLDLSEQSFEWPNFIAKENLIEQPS